MERRLITFIVASTAFFFFYFSLRVMVAPKPPPPGADQVAEADLPDPGDGDGDAVQPDQPAESAEASPDQETVEPPSELQPAPERPDRPEWVTLGSMNPTSGYFMLVTLNSRGGGIERIELTEREGDGEFKYKRVDVRHGYLGYFAGAPAEKTSGVLVNVVGPGTPADLAGIQVGDVISQIDGQGVATRDDIDAALMETKPGNSVTIDVLRGGTGAPISLSATVTNHPLDLVRLARDGGADQITGNLSQLSCLLTLSQVGRKTILPNQQSIAGIIDPSKLIWDLDRQDGMAESRAAFSLRMSAAELAPIGGGAIRLQRSYALAPSSYAIDMSINVENASDASQDLAVRLAGANGITLEGWWYSTKISPNFSGAAARDIVYKTAADGHELISGYNLLKRAKKEPKDPNLTIFAPDGSSDSRNMNYIGVDAQYFTVAYVPPEDVSTFSTFRRAAAGIAADPGLVRRHQERAVNTTFYLDSEIASLAAGESFQQQLRLFAGPKVPELLQQYQLGDCIYYGWFSRFAKLLAFLLHGLYSIVGNYAVAIILLTVIVRGAMFPLSRKAAVNAQKMQELAPEMKKINEKYKDDMEGKLKAQRELQQRVGFNPLAGCLPMFLQLPIFIGLYRALSVDIELRQAAFSSATDWASNLAGPDMFWYWGSWLWEYLSGRGTGWLGPYFNILPVIVVILFLAQQKMFMPPATDEQTAMTQKMMNIMTLMMGLFFFRVPAGLCIYFITSSLWGICERILVKKTLPTEKHFDSAVLEGTAVPTESKTQSLTERIRNQVSKPEEPAERPNKRRRPKKKR